MRGGIDRWVRRDRPGPGELDLRQPVGAVDGGGTARVRRQEGAQLRPEDRIVADGGVGALEPFEGRDERLGHVPPAEPAVDPPAAVGVGFDEACRDGRGSGREVGAVPAGGAGTLREERDGDGVLARALPCPTGRLDAGRDVHAHRGDREERLGDRGRVEAAREDDRDPARHGRGDVRPDAAAGAAGEWAAGGVEEDAGRAGVEGGAHAGLDGRRVVRVGRDVDDLPGRAGRRRDRGGRLRAGQLDRIGIRGGDGRREVRGRHVGRDEDDRRAPGAGQEPRGRASGRSGREGDSRRGGRPDRGRETCGLVERKGAGGPRDEVQADRVDTGPDGREGAGLVRDTADLHERRAILGREVGRERARGDERPDGGFRVGRAHECLADERGVEAGRAPCRDGAGLADPGFGDGDPVARDQGPQPDRGLRVDLERTEIAVVHADQTCVGRERAVDLARAMDLHERLQPEIARETHEAGQATRRVKDGEQEDRVGTGGAQEGELPVVDDELLRQDRCGDGGADRAQVVD